MILVVVLYGLACAVCGAEDELWHDVVLGVVECRACGDRAATGGDRDGDGGAYEGGEMYADEYGDRDEFGGWR